MIEGNLIKEMPLKDIVINDRVVGKKFGALVLINGEDGKPSLTFNGEYYIEKEHTPCVIFNNNLYHMWYSVNKGDTYWRIYYSTSKDGINWSTGIQLVDLNINKCKTCDIHSPSVVYDGTKYHMWYSVFDGNNEKIYYTTSKDGKFWLKQDQVKILTECNNNIFFNPSVIYDGKLYHMWYGCNDGVKEKIFYATSEDCINWIKHGAIGIVSYDDVSENIELSSLSAIYDGVSFHILYSKCIGNKYKIYYNVSKDGLLFYERGVVIDVGHESDSDSFIVDKPSIIKVNDKYKVWYTGYNGARWRIHYAELYPDVLENTLNIK